MASPPASIPDSQLGLAPEDVQLLRYAQHHAQSSSRAASQASSQGRLLLDPSSLQQLNSYFDRILASVQQRWAELYDQMQNATNAQYDNAGNAITSADQAIEYYQDILRQLDEVQVEFDKIKRVGEIVRGIMQRVDALDQHF